MNIISSSVIDVEVGKKNSPFEEIMRQLEEQAMCGEYLIVRQFRYKTETPLPEFTIQTMREVFHDFIEEPPRTPRDIFFDAYPDPIKPIDGTIDLVTDKMKTSAEQLDLSVFCGGMFGSTEVMKDLPKGLHAKAAIIFELFWQKITEHFTLPPTRVYEHVPLEGSCFYEDCAWQFCFIFLNDHLGEGIVLSGDNFYNFSPNYHLCRGQCSDFGKRCNEDMLKNSKNKTDAPEQETFITQSLMYSIMLRCRHVDRRLNGNLKKRVGELLKQCAEIHGWEVHELNITQFFQENCVQMLVRLGPNVSVSRVVQVLGFESNRKIREEYPNLGEFTGGNSFWLDGYFTESIGLENKEARLESNFVYLVGGGVYTRTEAID